MTDKQIPADDLRRFIARCRTAVNGRGSILLDELEALLPDPPRPTLADMTMEERYACLWMQADVENHSRRYVIANPSDEEGDAALIAADGEIDWIFPEYVTPRPDLPRLEWPGTEKPDPVAALPDGWRLADHEDHGRVIVTTPTPTRDGRVYYVLPSADPLGYDWLSCGPDELTYIDTDQEDDTPTTPGHLAVGTVIESADDPRIAALPVGSILLDRDEEAITKRRWAWMGRGHTPDEDGRDEFGPWTVLHIPKEADQ